jgi:glycosyltransferase involved in cell wall biosynthesis
MNGKVELSVVVPFYNEQENAASVINDLRKLLPSSLSYEIIAVDNGSRDDTAAVLRSLESDIVKVVTVPVNKGYGLGVRTGLENASGRVVGWTDGDGQVPAGAVLDAYNMLEKTGCDMIKTRRVSRNDGLMRKVASRVFSSMLFVMFGLSYPDINAKPKMFLREHLREMSVRSDDWFLDTEIMLSAKRMGLDVRTIDIVFSKRKNGRSNIKIGTILQFIKNAIMHRFRR